MRLIISLLLLAYLIAGVPCGDQFVKEGIFWAEDICFEIVGIDESVCFLSDISQTNRAFLNKPFCNSDVFGDCLAALHPQSGTFTTTGAMILISALLYR
jgi:hypothetical protein